MQWGDRVSNPYNMTSDFSFLHLSTTFITYFLRRLFTPISYSMSFIFLKLKHSQFTWWLLIAIINIHSIKMRLIECISNRFLAILVLHVIFRYCIDKNRCTNNNSTHWANNRFYQKDIMSVDSVSFCHSMFFFTFCCPNFLLYAHDL